MSKRICDIHILKKKIIIYFDTDKIEITPNTYTEFNLYLNKALNDETINEIKRFDEYQKHLSYALNLVNQYAYTTKKLERKLLNRKIDQKTIEAIINYLNKNHLLDDKAFALDYALTLLNRYKGPYFIKKRLKELGIIDADIDLALNSLKTKDINETLINYLKKLDQQYSRKNVINKRDKIIRAAVSRGWPINEVNNALKRIKLNKTNYESAVKKDYEKIKRQYDERNKIINALKRKGYSYSKIKAVMEEDYDFS